MVEQAVSDSSGTQQAIAIGPRIVASGGFDLLYREGMALIEEVAGYLDGDGREESRAPPEFHHHGAAEALPEA